MRARSRATRRLVAHLALALVAASLTVACTAEEGSPAAEPVLEAEPTVVVVAVAPEPEPAALPTEAPAATPVATSTPMRSLSATSDPWSVPTEPFLIGNTLGRGMALRRAPTSADLVKSWPDGTKLEGLGAQQDARGWTWAWVRDPEGNAGWIPTRFLVRSLDETPPPLPLTPAPPEIPSRTVKAEAPAATPTATSAAPPATSASNVAAPAQPTAAKAPVQPTAAKAPAQSNASKAPASGVRPDRSEAGLR